MKKVLFTVVLLLLLSKCYCQNNAYPIVSISISNDSVYKSGLFGPLEIYATASKSVVGKKRVGVKILGLDTLINKIKLSDSVIIINDGDKSGFVTLKVQPDTFQVGNKKIKVQIYPISDGLILSKNNSNELIVSDFNSCDYIEYGINYFHDIKKNLYYIIPTYLDSLLLSNISDNWYKLKFDKHNNVKELFEKNSYFFDNENIHIITEKEFNKLEIYKYEKALEINQFNHFHDHYAMIALWTRMGDLKRDIMDWNGSLIAYEKCLELNANKNYIFWRIGELNYKMKNYSKAINYYYEVIKENMNCNFDGYLMEQATEEFIGDDKVSNSYCVREINKSIGDCKFKLKDYKGALESYEIAQDHSSYHHLSRGIYNFNLKKYSEALNNIDLALSVDSLNKSRDVDEYPYRVFDMPYHPIHIRESQLLNDSDLISALLIRGNAHLELRNYTEAKIDFKHALYIDAYNLNILNGLGVSYFRLNDYKNAIDAYNLIITLKPNSEKIYALRGLCKIKLGDKNGGCLDLKKSLDLGYTQANEIINTYCKN